MKFSVVVFIVVICGKTGFSLPNRAISHSKSDEGSGKYCIIDDYDNTVECDSENSVLPSGLDTGSYANSDEYICLDVTYATGWIPFRHVERSQQCALKLESDIDLCRLLEYRNSIYSCTEDTPYSTPTVVPPSNLYCQVDEEGDSVECNKANSELPDNLSIGNARESDSYTCISVTYNTGYWPFQRSFEAVQCAHSLIGYDLCQVIEYLNDVDQCDTFAPASPTTAAPTTAAPTTDAPTTAVPTTAVPTTAAPTTAAPTTAAPTEEPTTEETTTEDLSLED